MLSRWYESKEKAVELRKAGISIKKIEKELNIPRSTLSGWFKHVELSESQKKKLQQDWMNSLLAARKKAALWHKAQKEKRLAQAKKDSLKTLAKVDSTDPVVLELALALLYLGEGSKKKIGTSLGNSDPMILKFFISVLRTVYRVDISRIRCELHLRADQDIDTLKQYWSHELGLPLENFTYASLDKRTRGSKTYSTYKGVCDVRCGSPAIQRRLIFLSTFFCKKVIRDYLGS